MHRERDLTLLAKVWPPPPAPPPCPSNLATYKCEPYRRAPNLAHRGVILTLCSINYSGQTVMTNPSSLISFSPSHSEWVQRVEWPAVHLCFGVDSVNVVMFVLFLIIFPYTHLWSKMWFYSFSVSGCGFSSYALCYFVVLSTNVMFLSYSFCLSNPPGPTGARAYFWTSEYHRGGGGWGVRGSDSA